MSNMMQSPEFLRSMSDLMSRPEVVDQVRSRVNNLSLENTDDLSFRSLLPIHNWPPWVPKSGK